MTEKRFKLRLSKLGDGMITDTQKREHLYFDKEFLDVTLPKTTERLNELAEENEQLKIFLKAVNEELDLANRDYDILEEENEELKSTIAQLIEQNRKNNDLLLSDIRILEKALWCSGCENDYGRLKELRKEFMR